MMTIQNSRLIYQYHIQSNESVDKKFPSNRQFLQQKMPNSLRKAIDLVGHYSYEELYDLESKDVMPLEEALSEVLVAFQGKNEQLNQLRYVWMALTLAVIVKPTLKYYQPDNLIPEKTINCLKDWLLITFRKILNPDQQLTSHLEHIEFADFNSDSEKTISSLQVLYEALDVFENAIKSLESERSLQALLDILEDCLEGYAIFTGSYGRRELFDWWLQDVVPSCWYLLPPCSLDSLDTLTDDDKISAMRELEEISTPIWHLYCTPP